MHMHMQNWMPTSHPVHTTSERRWPRIHKVKKAGAGGIIPDVKPSRMQVRGRGAAATSAAAVPPQQGPPGAGPSANNVQEVSSLLAQMANNAAAGGWTTSLAQFVLDGAGQAVAAGTTAAYALALAQAAASSAAAVQAFAEALNLAAEQQYAGPAQRAVVAVSNSIMCHSNADAAEAWEDVVEAAVAPAGGAGAGPRAPGVCPLVSAALQASFSDCGGGMWYSASGATTDLSQTIIAQCNPGVGSTLPTVQMTSSGGS